MLRYELIKEIETPELTIPIGSVFQRQEPNFFTKGNRTYLIGEDNYSIVWGENRTVQYHKSKVENSPGFFAKMRKWSLLEILEIKTSSYGTIRGAIKAILLFSLLPVSSGAFKGVHVGGKSFSTSYSGCLPNSFVIRKEIHKALINENTHSHENIKGLSFIHDEIIRSLIELVFTK